jgi:serine/threonine protein kinase/tetratricopeptide (TPR) repeat protein
VDLAGEKDRTGVVDVAASQDLGRDPRVGPYRLIREIGRGGMGTVYLAVRDDDAFEQRVAIKILKRGMDTDSIASRFRNERQILASLNHPNIAGLVDGGTTTDGLPYFAMEFVEGRQLVDYCEWQRLDTSARLDLFREVCAAVQYAHQNLIIHRDIKPANVLVTSEGTPKLLDFGIAKLLNAELDGQTHALTVAGMQMMTPEYASPEQVRGEPVTTATDVYSLGMLLYELLTGRRPYRITSREPTEVARVVCEVVPARPSTTVTQDPDDAAVHEPPTGAPPTGAPAPAEHARAHRAMADHARAIDTQRLRRRLAGDLDTIVLKALSKEPARRYASVDQFSEDVRRHLAGLPVLARRDTFGYRTSKFVRRHRAAVVAASLTFLALVAGVIGTAWQAREARIARARAESRFDDVRRLANAFVFEMHDAIRDLPGSTPARRLLVSRALEYLDRLAREGGDRTDLQRELASAYLRIGDVQGRPFVPNLGDTAGALASYRKARAIYEGIGAEASADPALRRDLGTAFLRLTDVLSASGNTADALVLARKGLALHEATTNESSPPEARRELIAGNSRFGDMLSATGDATAALAQRRKVLAMMEALAAQAPTQPDNLRQLIAANQRMANTLGNPNYPNVGDFAGALPYIERSTALARQATVLYPDNALFRRLLSVASSNTADVLQALQRVPEALERRRESLAIARALADADPSNAAAQNDLGIGHSKMAEILELQGRLREARLDHARALAIHQRLAAFDPENDGLKLEVASDYNRLAAVQTKLGERAAALQNHDYAVTMSRAISAANPANVEQRIAVALALEGRGTAYAEFARRGGRSATRAGDLAAAERDYAELVEIMSALQAKGVIHGTDVTTLENGRKELDRIRADRSRTAR